MPVKVVVLGAGGLVGARLCERLVKMDAMHVTPEQKEPIGKIVLFDLRDPKAVPEETRADPRVEVVLGDLSDKETMTKVVDPEGFTHVTTIHLAAVLSGYAEEDFDLGLKINLFGSINVLECMRALKEKLGKKRVVVFFDNDDYGAGLKKYFVASAKKLGLEVVEEIPYNRESTTDYSPLVTKAKYKKPDAIFVAGLFEQAALIARSAKKAGLMD